MGNNKRFIRQTYSIYSKNNGKFVSKMYTNNNIIGHSKSSSDRIGKFSFDSI